MTERQLAEHIELLESRLAHQEAAIEELTRTLLGLERMLRRQEAIIGRLASQIRLLTPANTALPDEESPPPHY